jgi:hypothetical protein
MSAARLSITIARILAACTLLFATLGVTALASPPEAASSPEGRAAAADDAVVTVDDGDNAHPSGKDRSTENGNSGNQGKAQSDPDDNGNGPERSNGGAG